MPVCAKAVQTDAGLVLVLDPTVVDLSTCAYLVEDGASNAWRELGNLSIENGLVIGAAVGGVWCIAFCFKLLMKSFLEPEFKE